MNWWKKLTFRKSQHCFNSSSIGKNRIKNAPIWLRGRFAFHIFNMAQNKKRAALSCVYSLKMPRRSWTLIVVSEKFWIPMKTLENIASTLHISELVWKLLKSNVDALYYQDIFNVCSVNFLWTTSFQNSWEFCFLIYEKPQKNDNMLTIRKELNNFRQRSISEWAVLSCMCYCQNRIWRYSNVINKSVINMFILASQSGNKIWNFSSHTTSSFLRAGITSKWKMTFNFWMVCLALRKENKI